MNPKIDKDTLIQSNRLLIVGTILIGLFSIFDGVPFLIRAFGNAVILGALMFLIDVQGSKRFRLLYLSTLISWVAIVIHSGFAFIKMSTNAATIFQTITFSIYALSLLSVLLFVLAMYDLCQTEELIDLNKEWKRLIYITTIAYILPFIGFLGTSIGRSLGAEVELFYGVDESSNVPTFVVKYGVRAFFFVPIGQILIALQKLKQSLINVAP